MSEKSAQGQVPGSGSTAIPQPVLPRPLPNHLLTQSWQEDRFVVLEHQDPPGWWRRVADYRDRLVAVEAARLLARTGTAAVVMRQTVRQSPMAFVMAAVPDGH